MNDLLPSIVLPKTREPSNALAKKDSKRIQERGGRRHYRHPWEKIGEGRASTEQIRGGSHESGVPEALRDGGGGGRRQGAPGGVGHEGDN
jgi:hypothetical protein